MSAVHLFDWFWRELPQSCVPNYYTRLNVNVHVSYDGQQALPRSIDNRGLEEVYAPGLSLSLYFNPRIDILGKGTVGEVFRARTEQKADSPLKVECYALKRFLDRGERPHFARECKVLEDLALFLHPNIVLFLDHWTTSNRIQYMLFPLATGDLYTFFRKTTQPQLTPHFTRWFVHQQLGLCDALKYLHNYAIPMLESGSGALMRRVGFHHDIKPVNILLFESNTTAELVWKLSDFGSGFVSEFKDGDHDTIYNSKPSTGDPIYTAPEFAIEGRVSRPKDIWSLGCIYVEALIWISDPSRTAIDDFQKERFLLPDGRIAHKPMYWYQDHHGEAQIHPAVSRKMESLQTFCQRDNLLDDVQLLITRMLTMPHRKKATALELCGGFIIILDRVPKREG